jgi:hypothetical protein
MAGNLSIRTCVEKPQRHQPEGSWSASREIFQQVDRNTPPAAIRRAPRPPRCSWAPCRPWPTTLFTRNTGGESARIICWKHPARDPTAHPCCRRVPRRPVGAQPCRSRAAPHRRHPLVDQTLSEHRAAEGAEHERCHHRVSQCWAPLSPNQMCEKSGHYRGPCHRSPRGQALLTPTDPTLSPLNSQNTSNDDCCAPRSCKSFLRNGNGANLKPADGYLDRTLVDNLPP